MVPQRNTNTIPDLLRAMSVKVSVKDGMICIKTTVRKRLKRIVEVGIIDETNGFGLNFVDKTNCRF